MAEHVLLLWSEGRGKLNMAYFCGMLGRLNMSYFCGVMDVPEHVLVLWNDGGAHEKHRSLERSLDRFFVRDSRPIVN